MNQDSEFLLTQCSRGALLSLSALDAVLPGVHSGPLREELEQSRARHADLCDETDRALRRGGAAPKAPGAAILGQSVRSGLRLTLRPTDSAAAALLADRCGAASRELVRVLNRRPCADVQARDLARRLIGLEDQTASSLRPFL